MVGPVTAERISSRFILEALGARTCKSIFPAAGRLPRHPARGLQQGDVIRPGQLPPPPFQSSEVWVTQQVAPNVFSGTSKSVRSELVDTP